MVDFLTKDDKKIASQIFRRLRSPGSTRPRGQEVEIVLQGKPGMMRAKSANGCQNWKIGKCWELLWSGI